VRAPGLLDVRDESGRFGLARRDPGQGAEEVHTPLIHGGREHCHYFGIHREQLSVEIRHCLVGGRLEQKNVRSARSRTLSPVPSGRAKSSS
jgi:hypothetical protein